ncbi:hypothetical protein K505DRAFT_399896 [Melanomma pulvis-pyrius CBS 109.77]|uniref:N-acetyltransferase domain-containing protein n=1 Tax=Melanomma pulvis-pyrius CBS 109.77 TaxID=1314802 RepID=A0A6A6XWE6_9PLEO|nr:hypothetical protein K505DRAFT_399896 [Melanomma pulvis-pyrius CBS 109.77]
MSGSVTFQKIPENELTEDMVKQTADLFSSAYGVWGAHAQEKVGKFCNEENMGRRVKMSPNILREQSLPKEGRNVLVRALVGEELVGHAFATRWKYEEYQVCWVTQLCVKPDHRRCGMATHMLLKLKEGEQDRAFGILSSHPAAIMAALRAFGNGLENMNFDMARTHAHAIMTCSPVNYVKAATLKADFFGNDIQDGNVWCAFTNFWVDHKEPLGVLKNLNENGIHWPLGELPDGCEYLVIVEGTTGQDHGD